MLLRALLVALALAAPAAADDGAHGHIDVDVQILANLSVQVDNAASSTYTYTWDASIIGQKLASATTATITNDSGGLTERWGLSTNAQTINTAGGTDFWSLAASTAAVGADQIGVQAVLGSPATPAAGCPVAASTDWNAGYAVPLTATPVQYTSTRFADPNLNVSGSPLPDNTAGAADGLVHAGTKRALCWRIVLPSMTSTVQTQNVQITITAILP